MARSFELTGLDGSNPLGFLAALGTLVSLTETSVGRPTLAWAGRHYRTPLMSGIEARDEQALAETVADALRGEAVDPRAEERMVVAQKEMEEAKAAIRKKRDEIRKRGLRGATRSEAVERELRPLEQRYEEHRRAWLDALRRAVPSPELALGKRIDCTPEEYRDHAAALVGGAHRSTRRPADLLAAFGSDACRQRNSDAIEPTPFCFITGAGHQFFLQTARELMIRVTPEAVDRVLFRVWDYRDEGLSMRWDPMEDRRYALMDRDPTASDNKPHTMWMANLLAYRALSVFPTAPVGTRLAAAGWDQARRSFTWPLWVYPVGVDGVRSLVQLRELIHEHPDASALRARGVVAVYRAGRVEVGGGAQRRVNFAPARRVA